MAARRAKHCEPWRSNARFRELSRAFAGSFLPSARTTRTLSPVLALANFGKDLPGRLGGKADGFRDIRNVRAQEWIGSLFFAHGRRDGRFSRGEELRDLPFARRQNAIAGLDG